MSEQKRIGDRPPDQWWRDVPCGHPAEPVAWWLSEDSPACHCGLVLDLGKALDWIPGIDDGPGPIVPCDTCGCHVLIPPVPRRELIVCARRRDSDDWEILHMPEMVAEGHRRAGFQVATFIETANWGHRMTDRDRAKRFRDALYERTRVRWAPDVVESDPDDAILTALLTDVLGAAAAGTSETDRLRAILLKERDPREPGSLAFQVRELAARLEEEGGSA